MDGVVEGLPTLGPGSADGLEVIAYFDALSLSGAGHHALLRAAAVLSGTVAGLQRKGAVVRFDSAGRKVSGPEEANGRAPVAEVGDGSVWLERRGAIHPNDQMIVARLAHSVALHEARYVRSADLAVAIDAACSIEDRSAVLAQLRVEPGSEVRLIATAPGSGRTGPHTTVVPTRYGILRATLDVAGRCVPTERAGIGLWRRADHAPDSWEDAVIAYRLSTVDLPVMNAVDLGALLPLIRRSDSDVPHHDVEVLTSLDAATAEALRVLVEAESMRSAATELRLHHSTLQSKHRQLIKTLGYDPRTTGGHARYVIAEILRRLEPDH